MNTGISERDQTTGAAETTPGRSFFGPAAIVVAGSLIVLLGSGWLKSGGLKLAVSGVAALLFVGALTKIFRAFDSFSPRVVNGTPRQLAWIRIIVCLTALIYTLMEDLPALGSLPAAMRNNFQFFHWLNFLPGYLALLSSPYLLGALQWMTAGLLFLGLIGLLTRTTLLLGSVGFFLIQAILRHYTYQYHSGLVLLYLVLIIPWTPCAAAWSIDSRLRPQRWQSSRQSVGLGVYACFAVMAVIYLACGLSKLRDSGLDWFRADQIEQKLVSDALNPTFLDYNWKATIWLVQHHAPDFIFVIIGTFGLVVELGYVTVLFSRVAQFILPIVAVAMHLGILVFQNVLFLDLLMLQLVFLDADRLRDFWWRHLPSENYAATVELSNDRQRSSPSRVSAAALAILIAIFLVAWVWVVEFYPLSAWEMYAAPQRKGPVRYFKVIATSENGASTTIPTHDLSPALLPNCFLVLAKVFDANRRPKIYDDFLASYIQRRNRNLAFGSPIVSIDVQQWRWNYAVDPNDPRFGSIVRSYPYDAPTKN